MKTIKRVIGIIGVIIVIIILIQGVNYKLEKEETKVTVEVIDKREHKYTRLIPRHKNTPLIVNKTDFYLNLKHEDKTIEQKVSNSIYKEYDVGESLEVIKIEYKHKDGTTSTEFKIGR